MIAVRAHNTLTQSVNAANTQYNGMHGANLYICIHIITGDIRFVVEH